MWKMTLIALMLIAPLGIAAQTDDRRMAAIRKIYEQTNSRIAEAEKDFSVSEIFLTEIVVNRGGTMYPAVGHFKRTTRFYYTYGDREKSPYPNRVIKISVSTERSATRESAEYYFDTSGQLIFAFEDNDESENRYYFSTSKLIRWQIDKRIVDASTRDAVSRSKAVYSESVRLLKLFFMAQEEHQ